MKRHYYNNNLIQYLSNKSVDIVMMQVLYGIQETIDNKDYRKEIHYNMILEDLQKSLELLKEKKKTFIL